MSNSNSNHLPNPGQYAQSHHANFIEALKSTGGAFATDVGRAIKEDVIDGSINQTVDSVFGTNSLPPKEQPFDFNEYLNSGENIQRKLQHQQVQQEYEQSEVIIFNRRKEDVNRRIEEIKVELKRIAQEIVVLDQTTETVIEQEEIDPGIYHLSFFERLASFLRQVRKRVVESRHWAAMHQHRSQAKSSYYWHQANQKVGGTKFLLSQERQVATQTG